MARLRAAALKRALPFLALAPVTLWLLGVFPMDAARVCTGVLVLVAIFSRQTHAEFTPGFERASLVLLGLVPFAVLLHQSAGVVAGVKGVDFAIFTQTAHAISKTGVPTTTLLFDEPVNFLTHHFAPVLYLPGFKPGGWEEPAAELVSRSAPCHPSGAWGVLCSNVSQ